MDRDEIRKLILSLRLGYEFLMSDYATSTKQEKEYEREGLAEVDKVVDKIMQLHDDVLDDENWHRTVGCE